jgi:hypothetical protein
MSGFEMHFVGLSASFPQLKTEWFGVDMSLVLSTFNLFSFASVI